MIQSGKIGSPHPYLEIWLTCRRFSTAQYRHLPDAGGVLDQDYMLTWAFDILDEAYEQEIELKQTLERSAQDREALRRQLLAKQKTR